MKSLLFRCDTGPDVGMGHLVRCLAIAQFAERRGVGSTFLISRTWAGLDDFAEASGLTLRPVGEDDLETVIEMAEEADAVVVDGYGFGHDYLAAVREHAVTAVIDDLADRPVIADVIVNPNPYAAELDYGLPHARILAGPSYALLRPSFADARATARHRGDEVKRIFVMLGGSDPTGELPAVLETLNFFEGHVDVVTAVSGDRLEIIRHAADRVAGDVEVHASLRDPASLMKRSDLAVTAAGGTSWELACLGVPAIEIVVADNQAGIGRWLARRQIASVTRSPVDLEWLGRELRALIDDAARRRKMSERARELVDGRGADRVLDAFEELS